MKALCEEFGALYVADEVQTGLGRTGRLWAADHWGVEAFPAFLMIRGFTYLGWFHTRGQDIKHAARLAEEVLDGLLRFIPELMQELTPLQRVMVGVMARLRR